MLRAATDDDVRVKHDAVADARAGADHHEGPMLTSAPIDGVSRDDAGRMDAGRRRQRRRSSRSSAWANAR